MYSRFTKIKDLSDRRRLPLLGKIRLGLKVKNSKGLDKDGLSKRCKHEKGDTCIFCTHAKETDYFVVPPEVEKVVGKEPKSLEVLFPMEDEGVVFPQSYRRYGMTKGLKCEGNGVEANEIVDGYFKDRACPCIKLFETAEDILNSKLNDADKARLAEEWQNTYTDADPSKHRKECSQRGFLRVMIPKVSTGGIYQIVTSSINSIVDVNSGIDFTRALVGRIVMVPVKLVRVPIETHHDQKRQTHYTMKIIPPEDAAFVNQLRANTRRILAGGQSIALPAPQEDSIVGDEEIDVIEEKGIKDEEKPEIPENEPESPKSASPGVDTPEKPETPQNDTPDAPDTPQNGRCPKCYAPAGKPHATKCPLRNKGRDKSRDEKVTEFIASKELTGVHPKVLWDCICRKLAIWKLDNKDSHKRLIQYKNPKAKRYDDIKRKQLEELYYEVENCNGDLDTVTIQF